MRERLIELRDEALAKVAAAENTKALQEVRVSFLGKKRPDYRSAARHGKAFGRGTAAHRSDCQ